MKKSWSGVYGSAGSFFPAWHSVASSSMPAGGSY